MKNQGYYLLVLVGGILAALYYFSKHKPLTTSDKTSPYTDTSMLAGGNSGGQPYGPMPLDQQISAIVRGQMRPAVTSADLGWQL